MRRLTFAVLGLALLLPGFSHAAPGDDLLDAASKGDQKAVNAALKAGASVDHKSAEGATALMLATAANQASVAKALVAKGADVNAVESEGGRTALMFAADNGNSALVKLLISKGANVDAKAKDGRTALLIAVNGEYFDIVKALLDKGADVNAQDGKGNTALIRASQGCAPDAMEAVGEKSERPGHAKRCPKEMKSLVKTLLDKGANPSAKNSDGFTPVLSAMSSCCSSARPTPTA